MRQGKARISRQGRSGLGVVRSCPAGQGFQGVVGRGKVRFGSVRISRRGRAGLGKAWQGKARFGKDFKAWSGSGNTTHI